MYLEPNTKIWLTINGNRFQIPVNPEKLDIGEAMSPDTFQILYKGQIQVPKHRNLRTFKWSSFFPQSDTPFVPEGSRNPRRYSYWIKQAMTNVSICELAIEGPDISLCTKVTIKSYNQTFEGGPDEIKYSLELLEWRSYKPKKVKKLKESEDNPYLNPRSDGAKAAAAATEQDERPITQPVIAVGVKVTANGPYYYDSNGSEPHGAARNISTYIKRIVPGKAYPVLIGDKSYLGWTKESSLQVKG